VKKLHPELARALADRLAQATRDDLNFFAKFPDRRHRIRAANLAEIQQHGLLGNSTSSLPQDRQYYAVIRYSIGNSCLRLMIVGPPNYDVAAIDEELKYPRQVYQQSDLNHEHLLAMNEALK
jgi:hypothetical protein